MGCGSQDPHMDGGIILYVAASVSGCGLAALNIQRLLP